MRAIGWAGAALLAGALCAPASPGPLVSLRAPAVAGAQAPLPQAPSFYSEFVTSGGQVLKRSHAVALTGSDIDVDDRPGSDVRVSYGRSASGRGLTAKVELLDRSRTVKALVDFVLSRPSNLAGAPRQFFFVGVDGGETGLPDGVELEPTVGSSSGGTVGLTSRVAGPRAQRYGLRAGLFDGSSSARERSLDTTLVYSKKVPVAPDAVKLTVAPAIQTVVHDGAPGADLRVLTHDRARALTVDATLTSIPRRLRLEGAGAAGVRYRGEATLPAMTVVIDQDPERPDVAVSAKLVPRDARIEVGGGGTVVGYAANARMLSLTVSVDRPGSAPDLSMRALALPRRANLTFTEREDGFSVVQGDREAFKFLSVGVEAGDALQATIAAKDMPGPARFDLRRAGRNFSASLAAEGTVSRLNVAVRTTTPEALDVQLSASGVEGTLSAAMQDGVFDLRSRRTSSLTVKAKRGVFATPTPTPPGLEPVATGPGVIRFQVPAEPPPPPVANTPHVNARIVGDSLDAEARVRGLKRLRLRPSPLVLDFEGDRQQLAFTGRMDPSTTEAGPGATGLVHRTPTELAIRDEAGRVRYRAAETVESVEVRLERLPALGQAGEPRAKHARLVVERVPKSFDLVHTRLPLPPIVVQRLGMRALDGGRFGTATFALTDDGSGASLPSNAHAVRVSSGPGDLGFDVSARVHDVRKALVDPDSLTFELELAPLPVLISRPLDVVARLKAGEDAPLVSVDALVLGLPRKLTIGPLREDPFRLRTRADREVGSVKLAYQRGKREVLRTTIRRIPAKLDVCLDGGFDCGHVEAVGTEFGHRARDVFDAIVDLSLDVDAPVPQQVLAQPFRRAPNIELPYLHYCAGEDAAPSGARQCTIGANGVDVELDDVEFRNLELSVGSGDYGAAIAGRPPIADLVALALDKDLEFDRIDMTTRVDGAESRITLDLGRDDELDGHDYAVLIDVPNPQRPQSHAGGPYPLRRGRLDCPDSLDIRYRAPVVDWFNLKPLLWNCR